MKNLKNYGVNIKNPIIINIRGLKSKAYQLMDAIYSNYVIWFLIRTIVTTILFWRHFLYSMEVIGDSRSAVIISGTIHYQYCDS